MATMGWHSRKFFNLGYCYEHGQGTSIDLEAADNNYSRAVDNGLVSALISRANLRVNVDAWSGDHAVDEAIVFCEQALKEEQNWLTVDLVSDLYLGSGDEKLRNPQRAIELIDTTFVEDATVDAALAPIISEKFARFGEIEEAWKWSKVFQILAAEDLRDILSERDRFAEILPRFLGLITDEPLLLDKDKLISLTEQATRITERFRDNRKS